MIRSTAGDATLLQLVYSVWFPARPKSSAFDPLAGRLDGRLLPLRANGRAHRREQRDDEPQPTNPPERKPGLQLFGLENFLGSAADNFESVTESGHGNLALVNVKARTGHLLIKS